MDIQGIKKLPVSIEPSQATLLFIFMPGTPLSPLSNLVK